MISPAFLDAEEKEHLAWILESSVQVRNQSGFFLWTQGALQTLLPHEILICGVDAGPNRVMQMRWFASTRYFREEHFRALCDPNAGLITRLMAEWPRTGRPCILQSGATDDETEAQLRRFELKNLVAHGLRSADGTLCGFFSFSRTALDATPHTHLVLEMLTPYLHSTLSRALAEESHAGGATQQAISPISAREIEILHWIKHGKTTSAIAEILALSPYTVKNHVHNILRKLGAKSRSQAVAQAIAHGLLPSVGQSVTET